MKHLLLLLPCPAAGAHARRGSASAKGQGKLGGTGKSSLDEVRSVGVSNNVGLEGLSGAHVTLGHRVFSSVHVRVRRLLGAVSLDGHHNL